MDLANHSQKFLRLAAGKHLLAMAFKVTEPSGATRIEMRSWFVVKVTGQWLAITAGHVVKGLRAYEAAGYVVTDYAFHDGLAGAPFLFGVNVPFDPHLCLAICEPWGDYAAWWLNPVAVRCLERGGVEPIEDFAWGDTPLAEYDALFLLGVPTETHIQISAFQHEISPTLIPLQLEENPKTAEPLHPNVHVARLVQLPLPGGTSVEDIDGMSGGPILGLRYIDGEARYFVAGVQSGWLRSARQVTFYKALPFFQIIEDAFTEHTEKGAEE